MNNNCKSCTEEDCEIEHIIKFDDIKIEEIKIEQILKIINNNNKPFEESNINNTYKIMKKNNDIFEVLSKEKEDNFNKLINIIINDYKNHIFLISKIYYIFSILKINQ